jgi:hypothetical protein
MNQLEISVAANMIEDAEKYRSEETFRGKDEG